jgi:hypothetical protein
VSCRKRRYRDEVAAKLVLATIQRKGNSARDKTEARAYRCPSCKGWHLTSVTS